MADDLAEFKSKVSRQGTMLCFPLGKSLGIALKRSGFAPDQAVVVRFDQERLEIRPLNSPELIRDKVRQEAVSFRALMERMRNLIQELPAVSDEELEEDGTLEGELLGMLECLLSDDLEPALRKLESVDELGPVPPPEPTRRPGKAARDRKKDRS
jgi:hypothetical protein